MDGRQAGRHTHTAEGRPLPPLRGSLDAAAAPPRGSLDAEHLRRLQQLQQAHSDAAGSGSGDGNGASPSSSAGWSLPCGHAYHHLCLTQWLHQCHTQGVPPTCPMCQQVSPAASLPGPPVVQGRCSSAAD